MSFCIWDTEPVLVDLRLVFLRFKYSDSMKPHGATWQDSVRMTADGALIVFFLVENVLRWDAL